MSDGARCHYCKKVPCACEEPTTAFGCCPPHEEMFRHGGVKPLDQCIFCLRAERDELRNKAVAFDRIAEHPSARYQLLASRALEAVQSEAIILEHARSIPEQVPGPPVFTTTGPMVCDAVPVVSK